jgi:tetratricopeptide (TPR) repeat protein
MLISSRQFSSKINDILNIIHTVSIILFLSSHAAHAALLIKSPCTTKAWTHDCVQSSGIEYLYIYDEIDGKTALDLSLIAGQIPLNRPFPKVYLNSRGGNVFYARQIGRILRSRSASIEGRDMISPEREPRCASACVEVAAGGVIRNFIQLQVHKGYISKRIKGETYQHLPMPESEMEEEANYFSEMGIDRRLIDLIKATDEKHEWAFITYSDKKPLHEQLIYQLGFISDENIAKNLFRLHKFGEQDDIFSSIALRKLAEQGDGHSAYVLGHRYEYGLYGEEKNRKEAIFWFKKAGELGDADGYHVLGFLYDHDKDIVKGDLKKSTEYYRKAAEMGSAGSQNNLAWSYYKAKGVRKNVSEAIYWATRSAEQGEPFAYSTLAEIRFDGNGFPRDDIETLKWTLLAVKLLPDGSAKEGMRKQSKVLTHRMTDDNIREAEKRAANWRPLVQSDRVMRDVDDK